MFEFTARPGGIAGILADSPRDELFRVDGKIYTIPVDFPPTVALAYASIKLQYGEEAVVAWAMQIALGDEGLSVLTNLGVSREDFTKLVAIIVGRIQGLAMVIPGPGSATGPKARTRKPPAKRGAAS
jgi:hypothetical protein